MNLRCGKNGKDTGINRDVRLDAFGHVVFEFKEIAVVEKELGDDKVSSLVNFPHQVVPVDMLPFFTSNVTLRESGGADGKAADFLDKLDQLGGILEAAFRFYKFALAPGRISTECKNVSNSPVLCLLQVNSDLVLGCVDAGQVGHGGESVLFLDLIHDVEGFVSRAPACSVGDRTVVRFEFEEGWKGFLEQSSISFLGLRRKEFEGDHGLSLIVLPLMDVSDKLHWLNLEENTLKSRTFPG